MTFAPQLLVSIDACMLSLNFPAEANQDEIFRRDTSTWVDVDNTVTALQMDAAEFEDFRDVIGIPLPLP